MRFLSYFLMIGCCVALNVQAGVTEGKPTSIFVHGFNDAVAFNMNTSGPGYAVCATSMRYAVSTATQQGKNIYSAILAARATGQTVQVVGKNTCTVNPDSEDILYIVIL